MKKAAITLLLAVLIYSCNDEARQQAKMEPAQAKQETVEARQEAYKVIYQRDSLIETERNSILKHLSEYCPVTYTVKPLSLGGYEPGIVFIENKTGYAIDKIVVGFDYVKSNGSLFDRQLIEFNNLPNGTSQSKPLRPENRGVAIRTGYVSIMGSELTYGQLRTRDK